MEALYLIPTCLAALLLWQERKVREEAEKAWRLERVALLNRIQAPEVEIAKQFEPTSLDQSVGFDDDDAYWDAVKDRSEAWR